MSRTIGINVLFLIPNKVGGTENYSRLFLSALEKYDRENNYIVFCNKENFATFSFSSPRFKKVLCPIFATNRISRIVYEQCIFPFLLNTYHCEVVHSFGYTGPFFCLSPKIVTVHDANWKDHAEDNSRGSRIVLSCVMEAVLRTADVIVTDSHFSASRLIHFYPRLQKKIHIVHPWVGEKVSNLLRKKLPHPHKNKKYILCVSGLYPHKKVPYLLSIIGVQTLVLIGKNGLDEEKVTALVRNRPNIVYHPKVSVDKLAAYYQHASLFVFPSIYEGFGYPVYEAAAAGLRCLVGKKELYESWIQSNVEELSFEEQRDIRNIKKMMKAQKTLASSPHTPKQSVDQLRRLYATL